MTNPSSARAKRAIAEHSISVFERADLERQLATLGKWRRDVRDAREREARQLLRWLDESEARLAAGKVAS